jgi:N-acyl-D-aspartate/D-glutamate deacylase
MSLIRRLIAVILMIPMGSCSIGKVAVTDDSVVIDRVTVLDGRGGSPLTNARVVVRNGYIISVGQSTGAAQTGGDVIDGKGMFLLPGFI